MDEQQAPPKFEGETIVAGGVEYCVPSLSIRQAKQFWNDVQALSKPGDALGHMQTAIPIIHAALVRNYPTMTIHRVEGEIVNLANLHKFVSAVMGQSGIKVRQAGEAEPVTAS